MRIVLVEDNDELAEAIMDRFRSEGHAIDREADGAQAYELLQYKQFDMILLDVNLPGRNGYEILRLLRLQGNSTPVILLTARSEIDDRVIGLDAGADDYVVKPFDLRELAARCRALARRRCGEARNIFIAGNFTFDRAAKRATVNGIDVDLRYREVQLLELMIGNIDRVLSKEEVADKLYTFEEAPTLNAVEQVMTRLRRKLNDAALTIRTIRGLGYIASVRIK
ncbi:two component transcriptional regulator [Nitratireductor aquibiodomus RA22]|jgi:two-component system, OmpR family, response regulator TctD|uniref:Two-component system, OmpR family, response regulator TctD n=2 Tax=Nitratireductor aquibiodomus TaxID=204799 RepID=A0A1H4MS18_9HYPH|nr:response regulator transcription factor [Nitratireductor aquibiodomus]EIM76083.1 two component transcriptional regulator [Nitratireductor aquibiodomus RA22]SEB85743.1 two-component system, OmpR family, response regulator TctD [Nitratireductor aquibiodomus]